MKNFEKYKRNAVYCELKDYCYFAKKYDFEEVAEWNNGEGFDIEVQGSLGNTRFQLTWGEWNLLKKIVKKLEQYDK